MESSSSAKFSSPVELWQDWQLHWNGRSFQYSQWNCTPEDILSSRNSSSRQICQKISPHIWNHKDYIPSLWIPQWNRHIYGDSWPKAPSQLPSRNKDNPNSSAEPSFKTCKASLFEIAIPQWCLSILVFKNNSFSKWLNLPVLKAKFRFQNFDSTQSRFKTQDFFIHGFKN